MGSEKIKIEINLNTYEKIKKIYEQAVDAYEKINIKSVDDFITYVLENFSNSSMQFDKLNDQMKSLMENINLDNLNFEDLFKSIIKISQSRNIPNQKLSNSNPTTQNNYDIADKVKH